MILYRNLHMTAEETAALPNQRDDGIRPPSKQHSTAPCFGVLFVHPGSIPKMRHVQHHDLRLLSDSHHTHKTKNRHRVSVSSRPRRQLLQKLYRVGSLHPPRISESVLPLMFNLPYFHFIHPRWCILLIINNLAIIGIHTTYNILLFTDF
jgi:hypothetical protein